MIKKSRCVFPGVIDDTLMYARIHMGIPLTLYDVCIKQGCPRYQLLFFRGISTLSSFVFHINNSEQKSEY